MTTSPLLAWAEGARQAQRASLPDDPTVVTCSAGYGAGGLGRHLSELVTALRSTDSLAAYLCPRPLPDDLGTVGAPVTAPRSIRRLMDLPPFRFSLGARIYLTYVGFDFAAASRLPGGPRHLLTFNGAGLRQLRVARRRGYRWLGIVSANSHLENVRRQQRLAWQQYPIERPWAPMSVGRNTAEYAVADCIYVSSHYAWNSFVDEGYPSDRLRLFPLTPHPRFEPRSSPPRSSTFNVVYVGSLNVHKGVPLLIECFRSIPDDDIRLVLVGGASTRGMRRFVEQACASDRRISVRPGDPLPHLQEASVCVHPAYEDGFGYAPAEAVACGVPVIVSADTGMSDMVPSAAISVVPTGDLAALRDAIVAAYRGA